MLWPQQMRPLWPSVQMVIMKRREKTESEMKDAESLGEVRLREKVVKINQQATTLRIIKSIAERLPSPTVALGCNLTSYLY